MTTWVFQANPTKLKIDKYLTENPIIHWVLAQSHCEQSLQQGDTVYILRSDAGNKGSGGIIAKCTVLEPISDTEDFRHYWVGRRKPRGEKPYTKLYVEAYNLIPPVTREHLKADPHLSTNRIITAPLQTNFELTQEQANSLHSLWSALMGV